MGCRYIIFVGGDVWWYISFAVVECVECVCPIHANFMVKVWSSLVAFGGHMPYPADPCWDWLESPGSHRSFARQCGKPANLYRTARWSCINTTLPGKSSKAPGSFPAPTSAHQRRSPMSIQAGDVFSFSNGSLQLASADSINTPSHFLSSSFFYPLKH